MWHDVITLLPVLITIHLSCVSGDWKSWTLWGECSEKCGEGLKERRRVCRTVPCIGNATEINRCSIRDDCPGQWLSWHPWSQCDGGCGVGEKTKKRVCHMRNVQSTCTGNRFLKLQCTYDEDCRTMWMSWSPWSECDIDCGYGQKTRQRFCKRRRRTDTCIGHDDESMNCDVEQDCSAQWGTWTKWTDCHISCFIGQRTRRRVCHNPALVSPCEGLAKEMETCDTVQQCTGKWKSWEPWSICESTSCMTSYKTRRRYCFKHRRSDNCTGRTSMTVSCTLSDCAAQWSTWGEWQECDGGCGQGRKARERTCVAYDTTLWVSCHGVSQQHTNCSIEVDCPAYWAEWSSWSDCTGSCGWKSRARVCVNPQRAATCLGDNRQNGTCSDTSRCSAVWAEWGAYSRCDAGCGSGYKYRNRECLRTAANATCVGRARQKYKCSYRIDCKTEWNSWKSWSNCSIACGVGSKQRFRVCHRVRNLGNCDGNETQTQHCDREADCPDKWNSWSPWSDCQDLCRRETRNRVRYCTSPNGVPATSCEGQNNQTRNCAMPERCVAQWQSWEEWTACDGGCGIGIKRRQRSCSRRQAICNGTRLEVQQCIPEVDCTGTWGEWGFWGDCSRGCGVGHKSRSRSCLNNPEGLPCVGERSEVTECDVTIDCVAKWSSWQSWGECSDGCGRGFKHRARRCQHPIEICIGEPRQPKQCTIANDCPSCPANCKRCQDDSGRCDVGYCRRGFDYQFGSGTCKAGASIAEGQNRMLQYFLAFVIVTTGSLVIATVCYFITKKTRKTYATQSAVPIMPNDSSGNGISYEVLHQDVQKLSVSESALKTEEEDPATCNIVPFKE